MNCQSLVNTASILIYLLLTAACQQITSTTNSNATPTAPALQKSEQITPETDRRSFAQFSSEQKSCWNLPNATQIEAMECAQSDLTANQVKLALLIWEIKQRLNDPAKKSLAIDSPEDMPEKLDALQLKWGDLLKVQCKWESDFLYGSSSAPMTYTSCVATGTKARIEHLRVFLCKDQGTDGLCEEAKKF